ncbi:MAG: tetratricopeptide repeat protein [Chloroflexi bacterium]|nr:tetratricopeptide repeat protein [Chloroflexota bacterium]
MKLPGLSHRLSILLLLLMAGLLTACAPAGRANRNADSTHHPTPTLTPIRTATPGPPPTATPKPLNKIDAKQAEKLIADGKRRFLQSDLVGAEAAFINAMAADPHNLQAYNGLTDVYLYRPQYWQQALTTAQSAVALAPNDLNSQIYLALAQQGAHHFEEARKTILPVAKLAPDNATVQATLASVLSSFYELDEAYKVAQKAVQLDDQNASAWVTLGSLAYSLAYWDEAGAAYAKAVQLEPDFFAWHLFQARHELNVTGDVEQALALLQPARNVQPEHPWVLVFLVDVALEKNDWSTATAMCQKMLAANQPATPYAEAYSCLADVLVMQERYQEAEPYQLLAEQIATPEHWSVSLLRIRLYSERDECPKALALAEQWLAERPYSTLAMRMVGVSYLCDEQSDKAIEKFKQVLDKTPRSVIDARLLANAYARAGNVDAAHATLAAVSAFAMQDPSYYQALYEVALFSGEYADALNAAQRWQALRPYSSEPQISMALVQLLDDNIADAQRAAQRALAAGATGATLYAVLGETYHRQGNFEQAEQYLLKSLAIADRNFLAHNFILSLYLVHGDCAEAGIHVRWLQANSKDSQRIAQLQRLLDRCQPRKAQPTPQAEIALNSVAALRAARQVLHEAGVETHTVRFVEDEQVRSLLVTYTSPLDPQDPAFADQERTIGLALARLLPQIASQPDGLVLISGTGNIPRHIIYIATPAVVLWLDGKLTEEEFVKVWVRRPVDGRESGTLM